MLKLSWQIYNVNFGIDKICNAFQQKIITLNRENGFIINKIGIPIRCNFNLKIMEASIFVIL